VLWPLALIFFPFCLSRDELEVVLRTFDVPENGKSGQGDDYPSPTVVYDKLPAFLLFSKLKDSRPVLHSLCR
jgi:hypothetical protein